MRYLSKYLVIFLCCFIIKTTLASTFTGYPNYQIDIHKTGTGQTTSNGGLKQNTNGVSIAYLIGKSGSTRYRGIYQWDLSGIPAGSIINSITVK